MSVVYIMLIYPMNERRVDVDENYVKVKMGKGITVRQIYRALNVLAF